MLEISKSRTPLKRFAFDFVVGLAIFAGAIGTIRVSESRAFLAPMPVELVVPVDALRLLGVADVEMLETPRLTIAHKTSSSDYAATKQGPSLPTGRLASRPLSEQSIFALLALAFATITAINLALVRHVRSVSMQNRQRRLS